MAIAKFQMEDGRIARFKVPDGTSPEQAQVMIDELLAGNDRGSAADSLGQGVMLGLSDELAGLFGATFGMLMPESLGGLPDGISFTEAYEGIRDQARANEEAFSERNPGTATALELAGGLATGGVGGARAVGSTVARGIPKYARYAMAGAAPGAVAGFGSGEGFGDSLSQAGTGAAMGAGMGMAIPAVANQVKGLAGWLRDVLGRPATTAQRKVAEAMARDGMTPEQIIRRLQSREGSILPDVGGENTKRLARAAAAFPGRAAHESDSFLTTRQFNAGNRLQQAIHRTLSNDDDVYAMIDQVNRVARERAGPLYAKAYSQPVQFNDELAKLLKRPSIAQAFRNAKKLAEEDDVRLPNVFKIEDDKVVDILEIPDLRTWDYIKRGLDDVVEKSKDEFGRIRGHEGYLVDKTRRQLNKELERQVPDWAQAKTIWSSKSRYEEALKEGKKLLTSDSDLTARLVAKMTPEEKEMFRVGVAKALRDKINKMGDQFDVPRRIFGNKDIRQKLELAFPDRKSFNEFRRTVFKEQQFANTKNKILGNSQTARIEGDKADLMRDAGAITSLLRGNVGEALGGVARNIANRYTVPTERLGNELSDMMFNPMQQQMLINRLSQIDPNAGLLAQKINAGLLGGLGSNIGLNLQ